METTAAKLISEGYFEGNRDNVDLDKTQQGSLEMEIDPATGTTTTTASGTDTDTGRGATSSGTIDAHGGGLTPKDVMIHVDKDDQATRMHGDMTLVEWCVINPKKAPPNHNPNSDPKSAL